MTMIQAKQSVRSKPRSLRSGVWAAWLEEDADGTPQTACLTTNAGGAGLLGRTVRLLQTGNIGTYAFLFGLGVTLIIYWVVVR
jgi:hypothetical protein